MNRPRVYLDWNASAPLRPEARAAMLHALDVVGNPSAVHAEGRAARAVVERARVQVATAVGCQPDEVVFTSGATEAAGVLSRLPGRVMVEDTAHECLVAHRRETGEGPTTYAMGLANGETGIVSALPLRADGAWRVGPERTDLLLVDVAQAFGRVPFGFTWSGADLAILSGHKFGGPKGVGALIVRSGLDLAPLAEGGGQEGRRRSGTENVAAIAGVGAAAEAAARDLDDGVWQRIAELRNILESALASAEPDTIVVGRDETRLPNTTCFAAPGWKAETQVMQMDLAGFAISAGSACSSGKVRGGRVLAAMGFPAEVAQSAVRVSIGAATVEREVLSFADAWLAAHRRFRARAA